MSHIKQKYKETSKRKETEFWSVGKTYLSAPGWLLAVINERCWTWSPKAVTWIYWRQPGSRENPVQDVDCRSPRLYQELLSTTSTSVPTATTSAYTLCITATTTVPFSPFTVPQSTYVKPIPQRTVMLQVFVLTEEERTRPTNQHQRITSLSAEDQLID